jgi:hypothetical protein
MTDGNGKNAALDALLREQLYVVTRRQAITAGLTSDAIAHRIGAAGRWQRMLPGVYLAVTGKPTQEQREVAALLHGGPASLLTGQSALRRHLFRARDNEIIDVLVPASCQRQSVRFVRVHRTTRMPAHGLDGPFRLVWPARAVADTVREMTSLVEVRTVVADTIQRGRCSIALLNEELEHGPRRGSALLRQALAEVADGIRSGAEGDLRGLIKRAKLPMPLFNARLFVGVKLIAVADCWWPDAGLAAEVDSREWHFSPEDWEKTMRRHEAMGKHGIITLHFTPRRIRQEPGTVIKAIRDGLATGQARPPLDIRTVSAAA